MESQILYIHIIEVIGYRAHGLIWNSSGSADQSENFELPLTENLSNSDLDHMDTDVHFAKLEAGKSSTVLSVAQACHQESQALSFPRKGLVCFLVRTRLHAYL